MDMDKINDAIDAIQARVMQFGPTDKIPEMKEAVYSLAEDLRDLIKKQ